MFKNALNSIMSDLDRISKVDKNDLFESMVQSVIDTSYDGYCHNLKINYDYLLYRDTLKVLKNVKRQKEKREKKNEV